VRSWEVLGEDATPSSHCDTHEARKSRTSSATEAIRLPSGDHVTVPTHGWMTTNDKEDRTHCHVAEKVVCKAVEAYHSLGRLTEISLR